MSSVLSTIIGFFVSIITAISMVFGGIGTDPTQPAMMMVSPIDSYEVLQGGCTDGEYVYIILHNGMKEENADLAEGAILKINPKKWKVEGVYKGLDFDHGNDMCYNSKTGELIVVNSSPYGNLITVYDAETMECKGTRTLPVKIYAMAYSAQEDCYYAGLNGSNDFVRFSADFKVEERFTGKAYSKIKQTMEVYGDYIYFLMYDTNSIIVYDKEGNFISENELPVMGNEAECIFWLNGELYVGYYQSALQGAIIYKVNI